MGLVTQQDPIGIAGGLNLYGYANGDPINFSDPFGLCPEFIAGRPCGTAFSIGVGFVPIIGDAIDIGSAVFGRDLLTGESLTGVGIGVTVLGTVFGSGKAAREGGDFLFGGLKKLGTGRIRRLGVDAEAFKGDIVGAGAASRFNISVDKDSGSVFLTSVREIQSLSTRAIVSTS